MASTAFRSPLSIYTRSQPRRFFLHLARYDAITYRSSSSYPVVKNCPPPTCSCNATPEGLEIDRVSPLTDTAPKYAEHIVICTGRNDWASRIEDEVPDHGRSNLAASLKSAFGRGGKFFGGVGKFYNPDRPVLITNSSLLPSNPSTPEGLSAYLFPSFRYVPKIEPDAQGLESFIQTYVEEHSPTANSVPITMPTVFICGHGGRDKRCGIMGPLLQSEFETQLRRVGIPTTNSPPALDEGSAVESKARVGLISHIGGHKWAGNVIIYLPQDPTGVNQLAGKAIWYGRVEPKHVEGIVKETILGGTIINELCRGLI